MEKGFVTLFPKVYEKSFSQLFTKIVGVVCPSGQRRQTQVLLRKLREFKSHRNHETFMVRLSVRLAQLAEHRSYEPKVGSSILPVNTFGAACGAFFRCGLGGYDRDLSSL